MYSTSVYMGTSSKQPCMRKAEVEGGMEMKKVKALERLQFFYVKRPKYRSPCKQF